MLSILRALERMHLCNISDRRKIEFRNSIRVSRFV